MQLFLIGSLSLHVISTKVCPTQLYTCYMTLLRIDFIVTRYRLLSQTGRTTSIQVMYYCERYQQMFGIYFQFRA